MPKPGPSVQTAPIELPWLDERLDMPLQRLHLPVAILTALLQAGIYTVGELSLLDSNGVKSVLRNVNDEVIELLGQYLVLNRGGLAPTQNNDGEFQSRAFSIYETAERMPMFVLVHVCRTGVSDVLREHFGTFKLGTFTELGRARIIEIAHTIDGTPLLNDEYLDDIDKELFLLGLELV